MTAPVSPKRIALLQAARDRILVLDRGKLIASGDPAAIRADARVRAVYLGQGGG